MTSPSAVRCRGKDCEGWLLQRPGAGIEGTVQCSAVQCSAVQCSAGGWECGECGMEVAHRSMTALATMLEAQVNFSRSVQIAP
jgi:hypothetical protein